MSAFQTISYLYILVEGASTLRRTAQTRNLLILNGELVVIRDLFTGTDVLLRVDDDLLLRLH